MPSFILIHPTVWPQYTNVTDRTGQTDRQTDRSFLVPAYRVCPGKEAVKQVSDTASVVYTPTYLLTYIHFLGDHLQNGLPYAIGPLSCPVLSICLSRRGWSGMPGHVGQNDTDFTLLQ